MWVFEEWEKNEDYGASFNGVFVTPPFPGSLSRAFKGAAWGQGWEDVWGAGNGGEPLRSFKKAV